MSQINQDDTSLIFVPLQYSQYIKVASSLRSPSVPQATIGSHVVDDPAAAQQAKAEASQSQTDRQNGLVVPGPNVFEKQGGDIAASGSASGDASLASPAVSAAPASPASAPNDAYAIPPEADLITEELLATQAQVQVEHAWPEVVASSSSSASSSAEPVEEDLERVQHDLFKES